MQFRTLRDATCRSDCARKAVAIRGVWSWTNSTQFLIVCANQAGCMDDAVM